MRAHGPDKIRTWLTTAHRIASRFPRAPPDDVIKFPAVKDDIVGRGVFIYCALVFMRITGMNIIHFIMTRYEYGDQYRASEMTIFCVFFLVVVFLLRE